MLLSLDGFELGADYKTVGSVCVMEVVHRVQVGRLVVGVPILDHQQSRIVPRQLLHTL